MFSLPTRGVISFPAQLDSVLDCICLHEVAFSGVRRTGQNPAQEDPHVDAHLVSLPRYELVTSKRS